MIVFYSSTCESCHGNHALAKMKGYCKGKGVQFEERRTVLWTVFAQEAEAIMNANKGLKLPFFYSTNSGEVLSGSSLTPLMTLEQLVKADQKSV